VEDAGGPQGEKPRERGQFASLDERINDMRRRGIETDQRQRKGSHR
jgi:hypothetical protein